MIATVLVCLADPTSLKNRVADCFQEGQYKARAAAVEGYRLWQSSLSQKDYEEAAFLIFGDPEPSKGEERTREQQFLKEVGGGAQGTIQDLCLGLWRESIEVRVLQVRDLKNDSRVDDVCLPFNLLRPQKVKFVVLVVHRAPTPRVQHWDLGVVLRDQLWTPLLPIDSWQKCCQKIMDFLLAHNKPEAWHPPGSISCSHSHPPTGCVAILIFLCVLYIMQHSNFFRA